MKTLLVLSLIGLMSTMNAFAEEVTLPQISRPAILDEGVQRELTAAQIAELLPWAKDSKIFLVDLLDDIQGLTISDKIDRLVEGITTAVGESAPKSSELLMRYALTRGLVLNDILSKEMNVDAVGTQDARLRVLVSSIQMALKYYETDVAILSKKSPAPFVIFGLDYFEFLNELNKSIFDASAEYTIQRTALEWLQWDLYRDLNNTSYASQIVRINNSLKTFPSKKISDSQAIANIRLMKKIAQQLNVKSTLDRLIQEKRLSAAKSDEERRLLIAKTEQEKRKVLEDLELEKMRGSRSLVDIEKVKSNLLILESGSWANRREAVHTLENVIGGDVSLALLKKFFNEGDSDVDSAIVSALKKRLSNSNYLLKIENQDQFYAQINQFLTSSSRPGTWSKRVNLATILGQIENIDCYRYLSAWNQNESDSDVKSALRTVLAQMEQRLK